MPKTLSTSGSPPDLDGRIVSKSEALSQRIRTSFRFRFREWFLNPNAGLDYDLLFGHQISSAQTSQILIKVIQDEGGNEITDIRNIKYEYDPSKRDFRFSCSVDTIYGDSLDFNERFE